MRRDIYFALNRLSISTHAEGGYTIEPSADCIDRRSIIELFKRHSWITILTSCDEEAERIFEEFATQFKMVIAAGGVVKRSDERVLMIYRNGRWDLPKGHWEEGESIEECAVREVEEESGVTGITIGEEICQTLHAYYLHGNWELKRTLWFAMQSDHSTQLYPQLEEGIERAEWLSAIEVEQLSVGSFPTILEVLRGFYSMPSNVNPCDTTLKL